MDSRVKFYQIQGVQAADKLKKLSWVVSQYIVLIQFSTLNF